MKRNILIRFFINIILLFRNCCFVEGGCQPSCNVPGPWQEQKTDVCYGAKNRTPGVFSFKQDCRLYAIRLRHVSGNCSCYIIDDNCLSRWGCNPIYPNILKTVVVNPKTNKTWFPDNVNGYNGYKLQGFQKEDDVLIIKKKGNFTAGDELQVRYYEDWLSISAEDNIGRHCINVDVSCYI